MKVTLEIPNYIRKVKLSEARNIKYYEKGKREPKALKYSDVDKYEWMKFSNNKTYLVDKTTKERVIANPKAAGTPRFVTINGQKIYNGDIDKHLRNKVMSSIKEFFTPFIAQLDVIPIECFPIMLTLEVHDIIREPSSNSLWDVDNRAWPYIKAFQDCLTGNKDKEGKKRCKQIIPDDNVLFITQPPVPKFIPVDNEEDRKLVFTIVRETDRRILKHKDFQKQLKEAKDELFRLSTGSKSDMAEGRRTQRVNPLSARGRRRGG